LVLVVDTVEGRAPPLWISSYYPFKPSSIKA
jgi:hypothetical protein